MNTRANPAIVMMKGMRMSSLKSGWFDDDVVIVVNVLRGYSLWEWEDSNLVT